MGICAILTQRWDDGQEYIISANSRSLNIHERQYSAFEGEAIAATWALLLFRHYVAYENSP
jgi:hypothetical protein